MPSKKSLSKNDCFSCVHLFGDLVLISIRCYPDCCSCLFDLIWYFEMSTSLFFSPFALLVVLLGSDFRLSSFAGFTNLLFCKGLAHHNMRGKCRLSSPRLRGHLSSRLSALMGISFTDLFERKDVALPFFLPHIEVLNCSPLLPCPMGTCA